MAELLIRATNSPGLSEQHAYRAGDIIAAMPDGHPWGRCELQSPDNGRALFVLKIPGITVEQCQKYLAEEWDDFFLNRQSRRLFRLVLSELPDNVRNTIRSQGWIQFPWTQVRQFIENKRTALREAE